MKHKLHSFVRFSSYTVIQHMAGRNTIITDAISAVRIRQTDRTSGSLTTLTLILSLLLLAYHPPHTVIIAAWHQYTMFFMVWDYSTPTNLHTPCVCSQISELMFTHFEESRNFTPAWVHAFLGLSLSLTHYTDYLHALPLIPLLNHT